MRELKTPDDYINAARVPDSVPSGQHGPWEIYRQDIHKVVHWTDWRQRQRAGFPSITVLARMTDATLHTEHGDVVMEDSREEMEKHLPIWMAGRGDVLVSGLGLGCVVRGLLANQRVNRIDVVELDPVILRVVGAEFQGNKRVRLHHGDALTYPWDWRAGAGWDFAWHDVWTPEGNGVPLHCIHLKLFARYRDRARRQGAWAMPREVKRFIPGVLG